MNLAKKVFIAEDEVILALDYQMTLEEMGLSVIGSAMTGREAVDGILQTRPDLVLMDVKLSGSVDGVSAAQLIRGQSSVPILFVTACLTDEQKLWINSDSSSSFLYKPFRWQDLKLAVCQLTDLPVSSAS
jgi:DNA-binding response OmpR family regulator